MKRKDKDKISRALTYALLIFIFYLVYRSISLRNARWDLLSKPLFTTAKVTSIFTGRGYRGLNVYYNFEIENTKYESMTQVDILQKRYRNTICAIVQDSFPVAYLKNDPSVSELLVLTEKFNEFNIKIPENMLKKILFMDSLHNKDVLLDSIKGFCQY
jgi:hypothetical protein